MNYMKKLGKSLSKSSMSDMMASVTGGKAGSGGSYLHSGKPFLHGHLLIEVREASNLPDMEGFLSKLVDKKDVTDAYVDVKLGKAKLAKTSVIDNSLNPVWNESYRIEVCHFADALVFEVRDKDHAYSEYIGAVEIPAPALLNGAPREGWFPIMKKNKKNGEIYLVVQFVSRASMENTYEVDCYFPMHRGCKVVLYQDAHCYDRPSCWRDMHTALVEAKHIICISGWAVWHQLRLFRGEDLAAGRGGDQRTLGEILTDKANQGVKVYVMVWSEKTSGDILGEKGFMGTHDMETFNYFKKSRVNCALAPRTMSVNEFTDVLQNEFSSGAYTHHQKTVICDAPGIWGDGSGRRRLVAFVGGLDLTGGRWDTPNHELFSTLQNEHRGDFRNSNAKSVPPEQGPREPWHDIHSRVEGSVAFDVFLNFYERWSKQGTKYGQLDMLDRSLVDPDAPASEDPTTEWCCQVFRSITSDSAVFENTKSSHLNSKKGRAVDASIAQAYIQTIRNAQNFIYIENQYFLGSAYSWLRNDDVNCHHTIPSEIAQRIVDKIYLGQRFVAYIVIPMFPEGDPASAPIQEILYWQNRTMEMMYARVGEALRNVGDTGTHPTDWLLFLCPGKREEPGPHLDLLDAAVEPMAKVFRNSMRFPIYVHSKMMIVDDAYFIVGSANINQRSMAGTRDTEIAVGGWQPCFPADNPHGDVHRFRVSLFTEHFRTFDDAFIYPATMECVAKVKEMALYNWQVYSSDPAAGQPARTPGQILSYPLNVLQDGSLETLPDMATFPDFGNGAKVVGGVSAVIPQKVTT